MSQKKDDEDLVMTLFGEEYRQGLPDNDSETIKAIKVELQYQGEPCVEMGESLPLQQAMNAPLADSQWFCPVVFDGGRWKTYIIPPPWFTLSEWEAHEITLLNEGVNDTEPYGKAMLKLYRDLAHDADGRIGVSATHRQKTLQIIDEVFIRMEGNEDENTWDTLFMLWRGCEHFGKLFPNVEGKRIALKGMRQVIQQTRGRPKGSKNKTSKRKDHIENKAPHVKAKKRITDLWRDTTDHNPNSFMELLVQEGLAIPGSNEKDGPNNRGKYKLAHKGAFLMPMKATDKIRYWVKKSHLTQ